MQVRKDQSGIKPEVPDVRGSSVGQLLELSQLKPGETFEGALSGRMGIVLKQRRRRYPPETLAYFEDGKPRLLCGVALVRRLPLPRWPVGL